MAGICDDRQTFCFAPRPVERRGPDPQGADVRPRRRRRQPRRGRQGVLVVPGLHADPLVDALALPLPAGRVPVRRAGRGQRPARPRRARVRAGRHRRLRRRPVLGGHRRLRQGRRRPTCASSITVANRGPEPATLHVLPHAVVPQHLVVGPARPRPVPAITRPTATGCVGRAPGARPARARRRRRAARRCSATTRPTRSGCGACRARSLYPKDGINDHVVARRRHGQPGRRRAPRARCTTCSTLPAGRDPRRSGCGSTHAPTPGTPAAPLDLGDGFDAVMRRAAGRGRRATSPTLIPAGRRRRGGRRRPAGRSPG